MLCNNAGPIVQNALALGGDLPHNTFSALVEWATKIEQRSKTIKPRPVAATQWVAEGDNVNTYNYCRHPGHTIECCFKLHGTPQSKFKFRKMSNRPLRNFSRNTNMRHTEPNGPYVEVITALEKSKDQE